MSLLGPRPIVARVVEHDEYVVFWNGIIMPYAAALYIATRSGNVYPTPNVTKHIDNSFRRLRHTGALRKGKLDINRDRGIISTPNTVSGYEKVMRPHLAKMMQNHTTTQLFAMLDIDKAHEIRLFEER